MRTATRERMIRIMAGAGLAALMLFSWLDPGLYAGRGKPPERRFDMSFFRDLRIAVRSLARVPALWITVALTLALGIGANAAIFSVVRAVLLCPLANRDEDQLLYLRQSAPGIGETNAAFSIPEIQDIGSGLRSIKELGTFSEVDFTIVGLGTPHEISSGRGGWTLLRGDGPAPGAWTPADSGR